MAMTPLHWIVLALTPVALFVLYVRMNDERITRIAKRALALSPTRCLPSDVKSMANRLADSPHTNYDKLGPRTGRRYIIVGGVGYIFILLSTISQLYGREDFLVDGLVLVS